MCYWRCSWRKQIFSCCQIKNLLDCTILMGHSVESLARQTSTHSGEITFFPTEASFGWLFTCCPLSVTLSCALFNTPTCPLKAHSPIVTSAVNVRGLTMVPICSICIRHFSSKRLEWSWERVHFIQPQQKKNVKCQLGKVCCLSAEPHPLSPSLFTPQPTLSHSGPANGTLKQRPSLPQLPQKLLLSKD